MPTENSLMSAKEILDTYFLENRSEILEIAAFLDRIDRAENTEAAKADFRYKAFLRALKLLIESGAERTKTIQLSLSDLSTEPIESAIGLKGAVGACDEALHESR